MVDFIYLRWFDRKEQFKLIVNLDNHQIISFNIEIKILLITLLKINMLSGFYNDLYFIRFFKRKIVHQTLRKYYQNSRVNHSY